ncbi:MAG: PAS domain S-box protein [Desulfobacterales bacterium]
MLKKPAYEVLERKIKELEAKAGRCERAEKVLEESEAKYQILFENAGTATIIVEEDNTISMVNPEFVRLSGYCRQQIEGKMKWTDFVVPEDLEDMERYHRERREKGKAPPPEYEFRFVDKNGSIRNIHNKVAIIPGTKKSVASLLDITELKRVEKTLREREKHFRDLAEMLPEAVFEADTDMKLTFANRKAFSMFGYSKQDLRNGLNGFNMLIPEDRKRAQENVAKRFKNEELGVKEYLGLKKDGSTFPILLHTNFIIHQETFVGFRGIIVDITERKKFERDLQKANNQLLLLTEQLRRLTMKLMVSEGIERNRVAMILHDDLQQLLAGAKINLEVLLEKIEPGQQEYLEKSIELIVKSLKVSRSLTEELVPKVLGQKDLGKIVEWLCDFVRRTHNLKVDLKIINKIEIHNEDIRLFFYQSIRELLFNVVKHSGTNLAQVSLSKDIGGNLQVRVSDQGIGLDSNLISKDNHLGSQFGLFSIRERLSLLKGSLTVASSPGKGTRCTLIMPLAGIESFEEPEKTFFIQNLFKTTQTKKGNKIHVLVADDHKVVREGFSALFGNEPDIQIVGNADNGQKAIEMALELVPDVILMDVNMPKINGIEATRTIRNVLPEVRTIGLSIDDNKATVDAMLAAGAAEFINKNNSASEILKAIRKHGSKV